MYPYMSPKRLPFIILCLFSLQGSLYAQDKAKGRFGKIAPADFTLPNSPIIDSNANAVILTDAGSTSFVGNQQGWFSYVFKKHIRIKIINKKAFDLATVKIRLYSRDEETEKVDNLSASTYNLENGNVTETKLNKNEVFDDKRDKHHAEKRFTLPAVKEGSIIEYAYTIISDFYINIPTWEFQSEDYPCLWSDYEVIIPQLLYYVTLRQGIHDYYIDKGEEGHESYRLIQKDASNNLVSTDKDLNVSASTVKHHWVMKDIPAFHVENYISGPANYIDQIEFQLSKTYSGEGGKEGHDYMNTWAKATEQLLATDDFGKPLADDDTYYLDKMLTEITGGISGQLDQAKAIYYYVSNHFTCTNHYDPHITTTLKDVLQKRSGTVGDLNLLLIVLLRKDAILADPVLLSTRENGFNIPSYPVLERLNYVVARVKIDDQVYYLDAAHRLLGFGQLAGNCYNGHARIISARDSGSVYFSADSLNDKKTTMVLIVNNEKGGIEGSFQSTLNYPGSYDLREKISETGEKGYFKGIQTSYGEDLQISNTGIDSLDKPEMPVKVYYDFKLNQAPGSDIFYFNPLFGEAYRTNPFTVLDRRYPVEMPFALDHTYIFNMEVPNGYTVDELPKSARVALNGQEGLFEYLVSSDGAVIQLRTRLKLSKANFSPEDYASLRDFFAYIVKKEGEQIVLKKK
jgi:Domain of Unknown Function with PDB structure (DUF3857)/Transglutaminase-like superfamily